MRKLMLLLVGAVLVLGSNAVAFAATDDLKDMGRYFDADSTLLYASLRTDEALLTDIDALFAQVVQFLPPDTLPPFTFSELLGSQFEQQGLDLEADILSWLGDAAAVGLLDVGISLDAQAPPILAAIEADGAAALAFLEPQLATRSYTVSEVDGYTVYVPEAAQDDPLLAFGADVILLGIKETVPLASVANPLSDDADFNAGIDSLPADDYALVMWLDTVGLQELNLQMLGDLSGQMQMPGMLTQLSAVARYQVLGATALDGRTLVLDIAQGLNIDAYADLGVDLFIGEPLDLSFAGRIPEDALAVVHGSEFGAGTQANLQALRDIGSSLQESGGLLSLADPTGILSAELSPIQRELVNTVNVGSVTAALNVSFAGVTGVSLERDFLPTLSGDAALYLRVIAVEDFFLSPALPDFAFIAETEDSAAAQSLIERFAAAADAYESDFALEPYGDGQALVIDSASEAIGFASESLNVLVGAGNGVFTVGTPAAATRALQSSGGLAQDATFLAAAEHFVENPQQVLYLNLQPATALIAQLANDGALPPTPNLAEILTALSMLESASVSSSISADGLSVARLALTIAAEPTIFEINDDVALAD